MDEDHLTAPHRGFFENALGGGIFFTLLDGYNAAGEREKGKKFTRFFGEFFELHVLETARAFASRSGTRCFGEIVYNGDKSTDVVLFEGERAVFLDVVASRFNLLTSIVSQQAESIEKDIEKIVIANAVQMDRCIRDFRSGRLKYDGVDQKRIRKIFPVVVVVQPMSMSYGMNTLIDRQLKARGLLQTSCPLEVMEVGTFESFEPVLGRELKLSTFFNRKMKAPGAARMSIKSYLYYRECDLHAAMAHRRDSSLVAARQGEWFQRAVALVKSWGIKE